MYEVITFRIDSKQPKHEKNAAFYVIFLIITKQWHF